MKVVSDPEKKTVDYYDREAVNWTMARGGNEGETWWKQEVEKFYELLPSGKVLEIGFGPGKDTDALIALGYDYVGIDASKSFLEIARERNPGADLRLMSFSNIDFPDETFDGFWSVSTLLHVPKDEIDGVLGKIGQVVRPGGIGFISMKAGAGERVDPETGRWFAYYSLKGFHKVLERNGFEVVEEETKKGEKNWYLSYWMRNK